MEYDDEVEGAQAAEDQRISDDEPDRRANQHLDRDERSQVIAEGVEQGCHDGVDFPTTLRQDAMGGIDIPSLQDAEQDEEDDGHCATLGEVSDCETQVSTSSRIVR